MLTFLKVLNSGIILKTYTHALDKLLTSRISIIYRFIKSHVKDCYKTIPINSWVKTEHFEIPQLLKFIMSNLQCTYKKLSIVSLNGKLSLNCINEGSTYSFT